MRALIVDPPSGWKYGFPRPIPEGILESDKDFGNWLLEQGYPESMLEQAMKHTRYYEKEIDDDSIS